MTHFNERNRAMITAAVVLTPGGVVAWLAVGLIAGWLAGVVMSGGGFGIVRDLVLGLVGALVGGIISGFFLEGDAGFWGSVGVSFIGACVLIAIARIVVPTSEPHS
jgi:uncharacterized membrane protein YeaQ/YmgE (transglycosylase-associated protein family)